MITLTAGDGSHFDINGDSVIRILRTIAAEEPHAKTRIDWITLKFAREEPSYVAQQVATENKNLAQLSAPDETPIWFDAKQAKGPLWFAPSIAQPGTKSSIMLAGKVQYVSNTHEEVQSIIRNAGGTVLPIPPSGIADTLRGLWSTITGSKPEAWD